MAQTDRAGRLGGIVLAAVAGSASAGLAALAHTGAGLCDRRVAVPGAAAMPGMAMHAVGGHGGAGMCPILLSAALIAGALCLLAALAVFAGQVPLPAVVRAAARLVLGAGAGPVALVLGLGAALPLGALTAFDGEPTGVGTLVALLALGAGALLGALALVAGAAAIVALARRIVVALAAVLLLVPGARAPWLPRREFVLASAGVTLARRRPSRAPPALRI